MQPVSILTKSIALVICFTYSLCRKDYDGYALYKVRIGNDDQRQYLRNLWLGNDELQVDFWRPPENAYGTTEILVNPNSTNRFAKELLNRDFDFNVTNKNIQQAINDELRDDSGTARIKQFKSEEFFNFTQYNTWNEIEKYLQKLPEIYPDLARFHVIGQTYEKRNLAVVQIGANKVRRNKPAVWIDAGIHAREWISTAAILYVIESILNYYESDDTLQTYLNNIDWYFLPTMNPDGYAYSHSNERMWRKNRSPQRCTARQCCQGVDLNRNFDSHWGVSGASQNPCSETYMGPVPFSEPETVAVRDFIQQKLGNVRAFFTFHSYGQMWFYPYGYKKRTYPEDGQELHKLALMAVNNLQAVHGTRFKVGTAANILYSASGSSDDWAKARAKIKYVYSVELRPTNGRGNGFILPPRHIVPSGEEIWAAIRPVADTIIDNIPQKSSNAEFPTTRPAFRTTTEFEPEIDPEVDPETNPETEVEPESEIPTEEETSEIRSTIRVPSTLKFKVTTTTDSSAVTEPTEVSTPAVTTTESPLEAETTTESQVAIDATTSEATTSVLTTAESSDVPVPAVTANTVWIPKQLTTTTTNSDCVDTSSHCIRYKNNCNNGPIRSACRKTCNNC